MQPGFQHSGQCHSSTRSDLTLPLSVCVCKRKKMMEMLHQGCYTDQQIWESVGIKKTAFYKYKPHLISGSIFVSSELIYQNTGRAKKPRQKILEYPEIDAFLTYGIISDPTATLLQSQKDLLVNLNIFVGIKTIHRWRQDNNITYKTITKQAKEADEGQCLDFLQIVRYFVTNINQPLFYDESHSNQRIFNKNRGWSWRYVVVQCVYWTVFVSLLH